LYINQNQQKATIGATENARPGKWKIKSKNTTVQLSTPSHTPTLRATTHSVTPTDGRTENDSIMPTADHTNHYTILCVQLFIFSFICLDISFIPLLILPFPVN